MTLREQLDKIFSLGMKYQYHSAMENDSFLDEAEKIMDDIETKFTSHNSDYATAFQEAFNIQKENYGNGMRTHLAMIGWAEKWKSLNQPNG